MALLIIFNVSVYFLFSNNAVDNLEYRGAGGENDASLETRVVERAQSRLEAVLFIVDGLIITLAAGVSYYVAGKTLTPVEDAYAAQKKFVADAAHELRTPLSVLRTGAEAVLGGGSDRKDYERFIRDSLEETEYLTGIVNDLLFLARGDELRQMQFLQVDLGDIVRRQAEFMSPYAKMNSVSLSCDFSPDESHSVRGNPDQLKRLLNNLIRNAIDYNREQGEVHLSLHGRDGQVFLTVADTGIGINRADIASVYDRFYKADAARSKTVGGSGLGLSIAWEIVEAHRGRIEIRSEPGAGTEVTVRFPAA